MSPPTDGWCRREGKHVGGFVLATELQIEPVHLGVTGEQDIDLTGESGRALSPVCKTGKSEAAEVLRSSSL